MKILFIAHMGWGNVIQSIPSYLQLVNKYGKENVDVIYFKRFPTDSVNVMDNFPYDGKVLELNYEGQSKKKKEYTWTYRPPYLSYKGDFIRESIDGFREHDSEVRRNLRAIECLDCDSGIITDYREKKPDAMPEGKYITVHNGALHVKEWKAKKYPMFPRLIQLLKKETGIPILSVGADHEYIAGTENMTGLTGQETTYVINRSLLHVSTDTSTMHVSALVKTPCVAIFSCTDWKWKNIDKEFHNNVTVIKGKAECAPCQKAYHFHPIRGECLNFRLICPCQNINPNDILSEILKKI